MDYFQYRSLYDLASLTIVTQLTQQSELYLRLKYFHYLSEASNSCT